LHPPPSVQIAYNAWIAAQTHARGMGVAMKNNNEAAAFHVDDYDMVVNEECWINGNCNNYVSTKPISQNYSPHSPQAALFVWRY